MVEGAGGVTYLALALTTLSGLLAFLWQRAVRSRDEALELAHDIQEQLAESDDLVARLEGVIDAKRREVARLAEDLAGCTDPAAAVSLTRRLLVDPWRGDQP